ncbi:MAG: hypothetical protein ACTTJZ_07595 [Sphaerochaetaceae bacterium]
MNSRSGTDGDLSMVTNGPGLLLAYYVSSSASLEPDVKRAIEDDFRKTYLGSSGIGLTAGGTEIGEPLMQFSLNGASHTVGSFVSELSGGKAPQNPPYFLLAMDERTAQGNIDYYFRLEIDSDGYLTLSYDTRQDDSFPVPENAIRLCRFNGQGFAVSAAALNELNEAGESDYNGVNSGAGPSYCIHVFAAMTVQNEGFSNRFWTNLMHAGYLTVDLTT